MFALLKLSYIRNHPYPYIFIILSVLCIYLSVCLSIRYTNPQFLTDFNEILWAYVSVDSLAIFKGQH